jgi:hypothetical protein
MTGVPIDRLPPPLPSGGAVFGAAVPGALGWLTAPAVLSRRFDDSRIGVVFDGTHARTHLLDAPAIEVLERCRLEPMSLAQLEALCHTTAGAADAVLATVRALEVAGMLIRRPLVVDGPPHDHLGEQSAP